MLLLSLNPHNLMQAFTSLAVDEEAEVQRMPAGPGSLLAEKPGFLKPRLPGRRLGSYRPRLRPGLQGRQSNGGPRGSIHPVKMVLLGTSKNGSLVLLG